MSKVEILKNWNLKNSDLRFHFSKSENLLHNLFIFLILKNIKIILKIFKYLLDTMGRDA